MQKSRNKETEIGYVVQSREYLIHLQGLPSIEINDIIENQKGDQALVTGLHENKIAAVILSQTRVKPGEEFTFKKEGISVDDPLTLLGKTISPLGNFIGADKTTNQEKKIQIDFEPVALGINRRSIISTQLVTGITLVDTLLPLGRGQRQLLFGEPTSGKSPFLLDLIVNQNVLSPNFKTGDLLPKEQLVFIYVAIGKPEIEVKRSIEQLKRHKALPYTIIIAAFSGEHAPRIAIAPTIGITLAEKLRDYGYNSVVILDDLGTQAKYLREIALLSEHVPGRESYPGDIFYQQAYLIERAGNFRMDGQKEAVSITLFPMIEAGMDNFSSLIPTNVMATTDGHLMFSANLRSEGRYPSIDFEHSVTRVGRQTQIPLFQEISDKIKLLLTEHEELKTYSRFGAETTNVVLRQGDLVLELLRQNPLAGISLPTQAILLCLPFTNFFIGKDASFIRNNREMLIKIITEHPSFQELCKSMPTFKVTQLIQLLDQDPFRSLILSIKY